MPTLGPLEPLARTYFAPSWGFPKIRGLGFRVWGFGVWGLGFRVYYPTIMENQMEKKMENEMETGII